jgi:hypothetical protein
MRNKALYLMALLKRSFFFCGISHVCYYAVDESIEDD